DGGVSGQLSVVRSKKEEARGLRPVGSGTCRHPDPWEAGRGLLATDNRLVLQSKSSLFPTPSGGAGATSTRWARLSDRTPVPKLLGEEHALIGAAKGGDRTAFTRLVERYWDRLYRWLYHLTHDAHTAEDLAQETFLKAFAGLDKFRAEGNFQAWLFRIAHNNF